MSDSEWGDLLTSYDGTAITYDEIGNPLSYYNGSAYTFTWTGRQLTSAVKGSNTMSFTYNDEGLRLSKTVNGATTTYLYDGSVLIAEYASTYTCVYIYDESGAIIGAKYISTAEDSTWQTYLFEKNLQGDVIAVYSGTGTKLISYRYDAWGNTTTTYSNGGADTLAANNPITYRGYYYDTDLDMYYLQSRYYDPNTCRFINADSYVSTGQGLTGYNMFAYCANNPVMLIDINGEASLPYYLLTWIGAIHREIQERLALKGYIIERTVAGGRIDLVKDCYAYELKPITCSKRRAINQLQRYIKASAGQYVAGVNSPELNDSFLSKYGVWVEFEFVGDGIILYNFYELPSAQFSFAPDSDTQNNKSSARNAILFAGAAFGSYLGYGFGYGGGCKHVSPFKEMDLFNALTY